MEESVSQSAAAVEGRASRAEEKTAAGGKGIVNVDDDEKQAGIN